MLPDEFCRLQFYFRSDSLEYNFSCDPDYGDGLSESVHFRLDLVKGAVLDDGFLRRRFERIFFVRKDLDLENLQEFISGNFEEDLDGEPFALADEFSFTVSKSSTSNSFQLNHLYFRSALHVSLALESSVYENFISKLKGNRFELSFILECPDDPDDSFASIEDLLVNVATQKVLVLHQSWKKLKVANWSVISSSEKVEVEKKDTVEIQSADVNDELRQKASLLEQTVSNLLSTVKKQQTILYVIAVLLTISLFTR